MPHDQHHSMYMEMVCFACLNVCMLYLDFPIPFGFEVESDFNHRTSGFKFNPFKWIITLQSSFKNNYTLNCVRLWDTLDEKLICKHGTRVNEPTKIFFCFCIDWITMKNDGNSLVTTANLKTLSKCEKFEKDIVFNYTGFRVNG